MGGWRIAAAAPLTALGWTDEWAGRAAAAVASLGRDDLRPGRVTRHDGVAVVVADGRGVEQVPVLASVEPVPVVGDWVLVDDEAVHATLPRQGLLRRRDPMRDVEQLLGLLDRLVDSGRSVIVIEHHQAVMAHADWIIDLGPGAGHDGGRVVFEGPPADLVAKRSTLTGQHLADYVGA